MAEMSKVFPPGLEYTSLYDTTVFIRQSISAVYETLIEAGVLVLIVIMLFLQNASAMLVPATTVPVTIIGASAAMAALGFTVNLMTLFALILAIGIVVDDAIVIVENTSRYIEQGLAPKEATIKAMGELTGPILGVTLVLTAVFLPASFLPGISGQMFRQFALVIAATASVAFILGVVPLLTATGAGAASQQALGTVVFGGMAASTFLAIPFVPVFYVLTRRLGDRLGTRDRFPMGWCIRRAPK